MLYAKIENLCTETKERTKISVKITSNSANIQTTVLLNIRLL